MRKGIILLMLPFFVVAAYSVNVIRIGNCTDNMYVAEGEAGETKFDEPVVTVQDEVDDGMGNITCTDVTGQYNISYSILGGAGCAVEGDESTDSHGIVVVTDAATGTYVEKFYGDVMLGRAGEVKVKVIATPKNGGDVLTGTYGITVHSLTASMSFAPSFASELEADHDGSLTLLTKRVKTQYDTYYLSAFSTILPVYTIKTTVSGLTTDITDHFDVSISYSGSTDIVYDSANGVMKYAGSGNQWNAKSLDAITADIEAMGTPSGTLVYTFTPKAEYAGFYETITKTIDVRLLCKTTNDLLPLHMVLQREQIFQESVSNDDVDGLPVIHVYKYGKSDINPSNHYQYYSPIPAILTSDGASLAINNLRAGGTWGDFRLIYQIVKDSTYYDNCSFAPFYNVESEVAQPAGQKTGLTINDYMYQVDKPGLVKVAVYAALDGTCDEMGYGAQLKELYQPLLDANDEPVTLTQNGATYTAYSEPVYFYIDVMKRQPHLRFSPDPNEIVFVKGDRINIPSRFDISAYIDDSHNGEEATLIWGADNGSNSDHFAYSFFISDRNADFIKLHDWPYVNSEEEWEANGGDHYSYKYRHVVLENYGGYAGVSDIRVGDSIKLDDGFVVVTSENIEELKLVHPAIQVGDYEQGIVYNSMKGYGNESWTFEFLKTGQYNIPYTVRPWNHTRWDNSTEIGVTFRYSEDDMLATKIKLGYTFQVADKGQASFDEPEAKVVVPSWNDYDVTEYFDLSYALFSDANETGTTVDPVTGEVTIGNDATGDVVIRVTGTRKGVDIHYNNPEDAYYTIRVVDPATRAKWEVISTCKDNGCDVHAANPRFSNMADANGRMHFLTAGLIYGGTVVEGVPGISMTIGAPVPDASSAADWTTVATAESTPKCCHHETSSAIVKSTAMLELDDDDMPLAGAFYQFNPTVNGYLTIDAKFYKDNTIVLITRDDNGTCHKDVFTNTGADEIKPDNCIFDADRNLLGDYTFPVPLLAGHTYYLYDITEGGNLNLHGYSYQPAFIFSRSTTKTESEAPLTASLFLNGLSNSVPVLYEGANHEVSFAVSDAYGAGITATDFLSVGADGQLDPVKMTFDEDEDIFKLRITATVASTDASLGDCVSKTPYYDVQVIDIPTFAIGDETSYNSLNIQSGTTVTTTNISTDITMTFGGWNDSDNTYNSSKTDSWEYKSKMGSASRIGSELEGDDPYYNRIIDGFGYYNAAKNNPVDELNQAAVNSGTVYTYGSGTEYEESETRYNTTYKLPCRGAFVKFEPRESGTLIVYLVQNGSVDYHYGVTSIGTTYQLRWRPLYITDETGRPVTMVNDFGNIGKYLPTGDDAHNAGSFTLGISRCNKDENIIRSSWDYANADPASVEAGCSFDWSQFRGTAEDRQHLLAAWPAKGERESIIRLSTGGFALPHKAYVRYSFHVKAGKTYFVFQPGSKFEFGGFSFVPVGYPDECKYKLTSKPGALEYNATNQERNYAGGSAEATDLTFTWESPSNFNTALENRVITINDRRKSELTSAADKDVLLPRTFTAGNWEGVCLPFSVSTQEAKRVFGDDYAVVTCDGVNEDGALHFVRHANTYMEAGRPYLVKPSQDGEFSFRNVTIGGDETVTKLDNSTVRMTDPSRFDVDINGGEYTFKGIYMRETMPRLSFFAMDDGLYCYSKDAKIGGYRSYFHYNSVSDAGAKAMNFIIEDLYDGSEEAENTATGMMLVDGEGETVGFMPSDAVVYDVKGRSVGIGAKAFNAAPHGVYMINGKKIVK